MDENRKSQETTTRNEGEGNKTAARQYNEAQHRFAQSGKVEEKAREAERALHSAVSFAPECLNIQDRHAARSRFSRVPHRTAVHG